jgi:NADPH2:quinone reductase
MLGKKMASNLRSDDPLPEKMLAAWYEKQGQAEDVLKVGEIPIPTPGPEEVLVRLHYSSINPSDTKRRNGFRGQPHAFPRIIPNSDGAGEICAVGSAVPTLRMGQSVWIFNAQWKRPFGTSAQYICISSSLAIPISGNFDKRVAACLGIPCLTAHRALFADGDIRGQTVLVTGGAGAVGNCAIQMAKWAGAKVIATVSSDEKAEHARGAGADVVLNYKTHDAPKEIMSVTNNEGVHRIVEVAFGENLPQTLSVLAKHGVISAYASDRKPEPSLPFYEFMLKNQVLRWVFMYELQDKDLANALGDINDWLSERVPYSFIDSVWPIGQVIQAHQRLETGKAVGNVLIDTN